MVRPPIKNMHLPLPEHLYLKLKAEAERSQRPATDVARDAIDQWLDERERRLIHESIVAYAREAAGTVEDLDPELESASFDLLSEDASPEVA